MCNTFTGLKAQSNLTSWIEKMVKRTWSILILSP